MRKVLGQHPHQEEAEEAVTYRAYHLFSSMEELLFTSHAQMSWKGPTRG